jgi:hypothetical protein
MDMRNSYEVLVWRPEGKRLMGRSKCKREGSIKKSLKKHDKGCKLVYSGSGYEQVANSYDGPSVSIKFMIFLDYTKSYLLGNKKSTPPSYV